MSVFTVVVDSPVGPLRLSASADHLVGVAFDGGPPSPGNVSHPILRAAARELAEYFAGNRRSFTVPCAPSGTSFEERVWKALTDIPSGETRSYGDVARAIGKKNAVRAVGGANHRNPLAIIVPCHRVIGSDGGLRGYGGGLDKKAWLLEHERSMSV